MSNWMHIVGSVRVDSLSMGDQLERELRNYLGPVSTWEKPIETSLPEGTEDSLKYEIVRVDVGTVCDYAILFTGDLRDVENPEYIVEWIKTWLDDEELSREAHCCIRDGAFTIDGKECPTDPVVMCYDSKMNRWWGVRMKEAGGI